MKKTEFTDFKIFCILLDILPTTPIFNFRPYKVVHEFMVDILHICFRRLCKKCTARKYFESRGLSNMFHSKGLFSASEDVMGCFLERCVPLYLSVVFGKKRRCNRCRIFSCLCRRLKASLSGLTEVMTVIGIIYCVGWLSESLIHSYLVEDLHKPYSI